MNLLETTLAVSQTEMTDERTDTWQVLKYIKNFNLVAKPYLPA